MFYEIIWNYLELKESLSGGSTSSHGIIAGIKQWGASAHYMDAGIDTGNIIKIKKFSLDDLSVKTGYNLSHYT